MKLRDILTFNVASDLTGQSTIPNVFDKKAYKHKKWIRKRKKSVYGLDNPSANISGDGAAAGSGGADGATG